MILAADVFGQSIDLRTLILTFEGGENVKVDEYKGYQVNQSTLRRLKDS